MALDEADAASQTASPAVSEGAPSARVASVDLHDLLRDAAGPEDGSVSAWLPPAPVTQAPQSATIEPVGQKAAAATAVGAPVSAEMLGDVANQLLEQAKLMPMDGI